MTEQVQEGKRRQKSTGPEVQAGSEQADLRAGAQSTGGRKLRLTLAEDETSPLYDFQNALKERGIKNFELGDLVSEALATIPKEWWDAKLEELTPLEWKLHAALENPEMRAKLLSLLDAKK